MLWSRPPHSPKKSADLKDKADLMWMGSVGKELHHLEKERAIHTDPGETRRRRTIQLVRRDPLNAGSWGFTLQTYGIRDKKTKQVEVMTYVDYVELHGPAWIAGMRKGDVLLSVNGESVEGLNHPSLVARIQQSKETLRLVVLFEDCCRKVELYERYIKLKRILSQKKRELRHLEHEEQILSSGGQLSRVGLFRDSLRSSTSSDWDCYSEILSPGVLDSVPVNQRVWRQHFFAGSTDTLDTNSELSFEYPSPFGSSRESINGVSVENDSLKDSASDVAAGNPVSERSRKRKEFNGACGVSAGDTSQTTAAEANFYIEPDDGSDSEAATLRRSRAEGPCPGGRMRSNSVLLNEMRMQLIAADIAKAQACEMGRALEEGSREETDDDDDNDDDDDDDDDDERADGRSTVSDSEVSVVVDEEGEAAPVRLYKGVRINDSDEVTRL